MAKWSRNYVVALEQHIRRLPSIKERFLETEQWRCTRKYNCSIHWFWVLYFTTPRHGWLPESMMCNDCTLVSWSCIAGWRWVILDLSHRSGLMKKFKPVWNFQTLWIFCMFIDWGMSNTFTELEMQSYGQHYSNIHTGGKCWIRVWRRHTLRTLPVESCLERWDLWEPWLQGNGRAWRSIVRQAMAHSALQIRKESLWQDFHRQVCHIVLEAQVYMLPVDVGEWDQHACPRCKMVFKSCAAWSVHAFRKHGRRTPARQFASGRSCDYCLKIFHDHMGLVNHLKNNPSCYWQYSTRGEVVQPEPSLGSAAEIKARAELRCPMTYAVGPQPPQQIVADPIPTEDQHALLRAWRETIAGFEVETIHTGDVREALRIATLETCLPPFEILYVAKSLRLQMQKDGEIIFGVGIHRGFTRFINEFTVEWLLGESSKPTVELKDPQEVLQRWRHGEQRHRVVPKPLRFRQILVAHLFSGRRRPDDFQEWATREVWTDQRFGAVPLSVDIIFSWGVGESIKSSNLLLVCGSSDLPTAGGNFGWTAMRNLEYCKGARIIRRRWSKAPS